MFYFCKLFLIQMQKYQFLLWNVSMRVWLMYMSWYSYFILQGQQSIHIVVGDIFYSCTHSWRAWYNRILYEYLMLLSDVLSLCEPQIDPCAFLLLQACIILSHWRIEDLKKEKKGKYFWKERIKQALFTVDKMLKYAQCGVYGFVNN